MRNRGKATLIGMLLLMFILQGCWFTEMFRQGTKTWGELAPKEKAYLFKTAYNRTAIDYKAQASAANLTEEEKTFLKAKWTLLSLTWKAIESYNLAIASNPYGPTVAEREQKVLRMIDALGFQANDLIIKFLYKEE